MIVGIGIDIVQIARIKAALDRFGERFAQRILTSTEMLRWQQQGRSAPWLAKRFAAKEALAKAMGTGIGKLSFQDIEVLRLESGAPALQLHDYGLTLQTQKQISAMHISLSDEQDAALAFVVLERA